MVKKIKKLLLKLCFKFIDRFLKPNYMSKNIDNLISTRILPYAGINKFNPIIKSVSWQSSYIIYEFSLPDNTFIKIKIDYNLTNEIVNFYFLGTDIIDFNILINILQNLINGLKSNSDMIAKYFHIYIQNHIIK
jgi:hypothetical protein